MTLESEGSKKGQSGFRPEGGGFDGQSEQGKPDKETEQGELGTEWDKLDEELGDESQEGLSLCENSKLNSSESHTP